MLTEGQRGGRVVRGKIGSTCMHAHPQTKPPSENNQIVVMNVSECAPGGAVDVPVGGGGRVTPQRRRRALDALCDGSGVCVYVRLVGKDGWLVGVYVCGRPHTHTHTSYTHMCVYLQIWQNNDNNDTAPGRRRTHTHTHTSSTHTHIYTQTHHPHKHVYTHIIHTRVCVSTILYICVCVSTILYIYRNVFGFALCCPTWKTEETNA